MSRFLFGDELGNIKTIQSSFAKQTPTAKTVSKAETIPSAVQALSITQIEDQNLYKNIALSTFIQGKVAAAFSNGISKALSLENDELKNIHTWRESRLSNGQSYIGIAAFEKQIVSCTSNGALRFTKLPENEGEASAQLGSLPTRLQAWSLSSDHKTFAYGGHEVDLSMWNLEQAFSPSPFSTSPSSENSWSKKRKREALFPGEIWRAKNVQPDSLGLRQPIRISCLTYLSATSPSSHLCTGTEFGDVRRYDTRAARKPVADWKPSKVNGIRAIRKGETEHELFISDTGSNLQALDLRTGGIIYGYKGISGSVSSLASSPYGMASVASDRFVRFHSTVAPPEKVGQQQPGKGEVVEKVFVNALPTVIVWDPSSKNDTPLRDVSADREEDGEDVWETMQKVNSDHEEGIARKKRH